MSVEALNYVSRVKVGQTTAKFVLHRLADRADERYSCFPAVPLLAAEVETSERTIQRALDLLRGLRLISDREQWRPNGSQASSRYVLHGPWDDYAGTGIPFPEITTPQQSRKEMWTQAPAEGDFREGTAAAVALKGDQAETEASAARAEEAAEKATAVQESKRARGRKAAAAKPFGQPRNGVSAGGDGVTPMSPPPVTLMSPPPVTPMSPLESSSTTPMRESVDSAGGQSAGGFARAGVRGSSAPKSGSEQGGSAADRKKSPSRKPVQAKPRKVSPPPKPLAGEEEVWGALDSILKDVGAARSGVRPPTLRRAVREFLGASRGGSAFGVHPRNAQHALVRLNRGWYGAGGPERAAKDYTGPDRIRRPVGYLVTILTSQDCLHPQCEGGVWLTTGEECVECGEKQAERAAAALAARLDAGEEQGPRIPDQPRQTNPAEAAPEKRLPEPCDEHKEIVNAFPDGIVPASARKIENAQGAVIPCPRCHPHARTPVPS